MFIDRDKVVEIVMLAYEDMLAFFSHNQQTHEIWCEARREVMLIDPAFEGKEVNDVATFTQQLLDWLEQRRESSMPPWNVTSHNVQTIENVRILAYMSHLMHWYAGFFPTESKSLVGSPFVIGFRLHNFCKFVARKSLPRGPWELFVSTMPEGVDPGRYASLLLVDAHTHTLHICYDKVRFTDKIGGTTLPIISLRKTILYQIGLARTALGWFLAPPPSRYKLPLPEHEQEAWMYAHSVSAIISSSKARLRRLLEEPDSEWRSFC